MRTSRGVFLVASAALFVVLGLARPGNCAPIKVDFEQFAGMSITYAVQGVTPIPPSARLYDQLLATYGLVFTSGSSYVSVIDYYRCFPSGTKAIQGSTPDGKWSYTSAYPVTVSFFKPGDASVPAATDFVSVQGDLCGDGNPITLKAYDVKGNLVASDTKPDWGAILQVATPTKTIHRVQLFGHPYLPEGVGWDNLTFNPTVEVLPPDGDEDGDGLLNGWELNGYDYNNDGIIDLTLGTDPMHKDLFVEVDAMVGRAPTQATLDQVVAAFAAVPNSLVDNPDGRDGIALHIQLDETNIPLADWPDAWTGFDAVKQNRFGTPAEWASANWLNIKTAKAEVYHYCIFANAFQYVNSDGSVDWTRSGLAEPSANDFMVTLGRWNPAGGTPDQQAGTFMHELGHNLGLHHGGDVDDNHKPNYHSVMNYNWQYPHDPTYTGWVLDYSREVLSTLDESSLDENAGIGGASGTTVPVGPPPYVVVNESGPIDWNRDGDTADTGVSKDINRLYGTDPASPRDQLTGYNDWPNLSYSFTGSPYFGDGVHPEISEEMTYEEWKRYETIVGVVDFDPDVLNLKRKGQYVTAYIELPEGSDVGDIVVSSLRLNASVPALPNPTNIGDHDGDGKADLMVKFGGDAVSALLAPGTRYITVGGRLNDGRLFVGTDAIKVINGN